MTTEPLDLRVSRSATDDLAGLQSYLHQLLGEPFCFPRISYGDELTLHFGDLRPANSPKLKGTMYGAYVLGLRGSNWVMKSGDFVFATDDASDDTPLLETDRKQFLESFNLVEPGAHVTTARGFRVSPPEAFGLRLTLSDGSSVAILPTTNELEEQGVDGGTPLPALTDWDLRTPSGLLRVGPGLKWEFKSSRGGTLSA